MAIRNLDHFHNYCKRRGKRMAAQGIVLEDTIESLLVKLQEENKILRFARHDHYSPEDCSGKDFTVVFGINGAETECSFGVTVSLESWNRAKMIHSHITQFCWPIGTNPQTMISRIMELVPKVAQ